MMTLRFNNQSSSLVASWDAVSRRRWTSRIRDAQFASVNLPSQRNISINVSYHHARTQGCWNIPPFVQPSKYMQLTYTLWWVPQQLSHVTCGFNAINWAHAIESQKPRYEIVFIKHLCCAVYCGRLWNQPSFVLKEVVPKVCRFLLRNSMVRHKQPHEFIQKVGLLVTGQLNTANYNTKIRDRRTHSESVLGCSSASSTSSSATASFRATHSSHFCIPVSKRMVRIWPMRGTDLRGEDRAIILRSLVVYSPGRVHQSYGILFLFPIAPSL